MKKKNTKTKIDKKDMFLVVILGIIFDPKKRKILIGRREKDPYTKQLTWVFPGGRIPHNEEIEESLKNHIKKKTGYIVENLGTVFTRIFKEERNILLIYNLCEVVGGRKKPAGNIKELKWISPGEIKKYFTTSFHPHLEEYINNLK